MFKLLQRWGIAYLSTLYRIGLAVRGRVHVHLPPRGTSHDRHWRDHPAVPTDDQLTFGQRAADVMKAVFATWAALFGMLFFIFGWISLVQVLHAPIDNPQLTILNLILSSLAGLQCFVLLIAAKRADQIAALIALHTLQNTEAVKANTEVIKSLVEQNTALTEQNAQMAAQLKAQAEQQAHDMAVLQSQVSSNAAALATILQLVMAQAAATVAAAPTAVEGAKPAATPARKPRTTKTPKAAEA